MGRVEILTGRERRRIWLDDQKLAILEEVATSGLTITEVARRHDVLPQRIYAWRRKFTQAQKKLEQEPSFLPVSLVAGETGMLCQAPEKEAVRTVALKKAARTGRVEQGRNGLIVL